MTRKAEMVPRLEALGAESVIGDLIDPGCLARACEGVSEVLASAHGMLGRGRYSSPAVDDVGHRALVDIAARAGVQRFVYVSALNVGPDHPVDFFRTKWQIEQHLKHSGLPHVILRPSALMEWHAHQFIGRAILEHGRAFLLGPGTKPRNFVAARDVAEVAKAALVSDDHVGRTLSVVGPDNHTNNDVAAQYARAAGIDLKVTHVPASVGRAIARMLAPVHPGVSRAVRVASLPDEAFSEVPHGDTGLDETRRRLRLEDFIRERVEAFRRSRPA